MKKLFVTIVTGLILSNSWADVLSDIMSRKELIVCLEAGYMPFEVRTKSGDIVGFDVDLVNSLAREMGVKVKLVNTEWDGIIPALLTKKCDLIASGMTATIERNTKIAFSSPYMVVGQTLIIKSSLKGRVKSYKDLNNKNYTVASKLGTTGEQAVKKYLGKANYKAYQTEQDGVMEVMNGKVDAWVYDSPYNSIFFASKGKGKTVHLDQPFTYEPIAIGVRKEEVHFINLLNNFIIQMANDDRFDRMQEKWFKNTDWLKDVQ